MHTREELLAATTHKRLLSLQCQQSIPAPTNPLWRNVKSEHYRGFLVLRHYDIKVTVCGNSILM